MHIPPIPAVENADPEIARLVQDEARRQYEKARLIPSENYVSVAVLEASGSVLTNKYSEGYPGRRYYEGQQFIDQVETIARDRAKALFGVDHANVQPYSGSPANLAVYLAFAQPGDTVMGMALPMGGHLTHGWSVSATGKWFRPVQYGVRHDTGRVDLDEVRDLALKEQPKIIFCGGTAIPRTIDFPAFAAIAAEAGAILVADIAHIAGLIAGGAHPSPAGHADVITTTTHKTLRGPRGAMIMSKAEHAKDVDRAVFPGLQGGPHNHTTAAIAVALHEAAQPEFRDYAHQVVKNAQALAAALLARGYDLVSGGTDNHLILMDLTSKGIGGKPAAKALDRAGIETNYNTVPFDQRKPFDPSGLRIGTPAITTRGLREEHMAPLAAWMDEAVTAAAKDDEATLDRIAGEVRDLLSAFPAPAGIPGDRLPGRRQRSPDPPAAFRRLPRAQHGLPAAHALVALVPGPAPALVGVHQLQAADPLAVELHGHVQVRPRRGHPDHLDQRAVEQRRLRPRLGCRVVQQMRSHAVEHLRGPGQAHAGDDELGPAVRGEPDRVGPRRVNAVAFHALHGPAERGDQLSQVVLVIELGGTRMVA